MDFEQAERRFRDLQSKHESGRLDEESFRVEVAKLLLRDEQGTFWLPDADSGEWFRNQGQGWEPADPHKDPTPVSTAPRAPHVERRWLRRSLPLLAVFLSLVAAGAAWFLWQEWVLPGPSPVAEITETAQVTVLIASPADGSQVASGQVVAVESSLQGEAGLQAVDRVAFRVDGELIGTQAIQPKVQPGQTSLPLSQQWRPSALGEHQVEVAAYTAGGEALDVATITLDVVEVADEVLPEPACTPDAAFVTDVTIPPGTAFPPGARMDKVWQVRNNGTCAWGVGYELVLVKGDSLGAPTAVPVPATAAGDLADLAVTFWAPDEVGAYANLWQLQAPDGRFFGPELPLSVEIEVQAEESVPPTAPGSLRAEGMESGAAVRLTWEDRSDDEDAFRVYREDVEASIGLAPANSRQFVDEGVACGRTYRYGVVAFNAAGSSPISETAEVTLPACAPTDAPPSLALSVSPQSQIVASQTFTVSFRAEDDGGLVQVTLAGQETGAPEIDAGRVFTCTGTVCTGGWPLIWPISAPVTLPVTTTLEFVGLALDSSGQESEPAGATVTLRPPD